MRTTLLSLGLGLLLAAPAFAADAPKTAAPPITAGAKGTPKIHRHKGVVSEGEKPGEVKADATPKKKGHKSVKKVVKPADAPAPAAK